MSSQILIHVTKESEIQGRKVILEEYFTDLYAYSLTEGKKFLYRKDTNKVYRVDEANKELIALSLDAQQHQVDQLKRMITDLNIVEETDEEGKRFRIDGKGNMVVLSGEVKTSVIAGLEKTVHQNAYKQSSPATLVEIKLESNEIVEVSDLNINIQGTNMTTKSYVTNITLFEDNINQYDYLYDYKLSV